MRSFDITTVIFLVALLAISAAPCTSAASPPRAAPKPPPPKPQPGPRDPVCVSRCNSVNHSGQCLGLCADLFGDARDRCLNECSARLVRACTTACPPAPPPPAGSVLVELGWDKLKSFGNGKRRSRAAEPYLWVAFFVIDKTNTDIVGGNKLKVQPGASLVTLVGEGSHGNLPTYEDFQTKSISGFLFRPLLRPFTPLPGVKAAIVGSISVLLEEDSVTDAGARAGARAFRKEVEKRLKDMVNGLTLETGVMLPNLSNSIKGIQRAVVNAIKDEQSWFENFITLLGSPDDFLGSEVVIASLADGVPGGIAGTTAIDTSTSTSTQVAGSVMDAPNDNGKWQLFGHIKRLQNN